MVSYYAVVWCSILTLIPSLTAVVSFIISPSIRQSSAVHLYQEGAPYPPSNANRNFSLSLVGSQQLSPLVNTITTTSTQANSTTNNGIINKEVDVVGGGTLGDIMAGSLEDITYSNTPTFVNNNTTNNNSHNYIHDGLVTKEGGELNTRFKGCNFTNMERIALTANGNLQRIFSSYYDEPVVVHVDSCTRRDNSIKSSGSSSKNVMNGLCDTYQLTSTPNDDAIWDRVVYIQVHNQTICKATSIINVHSTSCIQLIEEGSVGLGQLFRYLNKLPTFSLLDAGRIDRRSDKIPTENPNDDIDDKFDGGMWRIYELQCEEMTCLIHEEFRSDAWEH